jgi:HSP20 family protein
VADPKPKNPPKTPPGAPDPWANFPGGNPFGPEGPFGAASPFGNDPAAGMEAWLRGMGVDPNEFRRLVEEMQRNLQDAFRAMGNDPAANKSFVSGFSVKVGPDGKPSFATFGNKPTVKPAAGSTIPAIVSDEREPLTDVIDEGPRIAVTMELPGVSKDEINLHMTEMELEITVDSERRKYHKRVKLPAAVDPKTTKATYNNGVLDVTVQKKPGAPAGVRIPVK